jgi:hypothetical protein
MIFKLQMQDAILELKRISILYPVNTSVQIIAFEISYLFWICTEFIKKYSRNPLDLKIAKAH